MSEVKPAVARLEVFQDSRFFDDNFKTNNWTASTATISSDGELLSVTPTASEGHAQLQFSPSMEAADNKNCGVRVTDVESGALWKIQIWESPPGVLRAETSWQSSPGLVVLDIYGVHTGSFSHIWLVVSGNGLTVKFDYVGFGLSVMTPADDLIESMTITRPVLSKGIAGATFVLPDHDGTYTGKIVKNSAVLIWLARDSQYLGDPAYKVFGGKIVKADSKGVGGPAFYIEAECEGWGAELNFPPSLLQKYYSSKNGKTIMEDAVDVCSVLAKHPTKFLNCHTNCGVNSTHDIVFDEVKPATVLQEMLEKAVNPASVVGYDAYCTPNALVVAHARNSLDHNSAISQITPEKYVYSADLHRVQNKSIKVYGKAGYINPSDGDGWTEPASDPPPDWYANDPDTSLNQNSDSAVGSYSVQAVGQQDPGVHNTFVDFERRNIGTIAASVFRRHFQKLKFWLKWTYGGTIRPDYIHIYLYSGSNYVSASVDDIPTEDEFAELEFPLGPDNTASDYSKTWKAWGSWSDDDWKTIDKIRFYCIWSDDQSSGTVNIDGLRFAEARFLGSAGDSTSQSYYGERVPEPVIDEELNSDAECLKKAESLRDFYKDPVIILSDVIVDGDHRYTPAERQRVVISHESLDAYFRIVSFTHEVVGPHWDTRLTLGGEPQLFDYVFRMLQQKIRKRK